MEFAFEVEGTKRPVQDAPVQQPMRPAKLKRNPDSDMKKARRRQQRNQRIEGDAVARRQQARQKKTAAVTDICPQCGAENTIDFEDDIREGKDGPGPMTGRASCENCGWAGDESEVIEKQARQNRKTAASAFVCPECGGDLQPVGGSGDIYVLQCADCGESVVTQTPSEYRREASAKTAAEMAFCRHCGEDIENRDGTWVALESWAGGPHCDSSRDGQHHPARTASKTAMEYVSCPACGGTGRQEGSESLYGDDFFFATDQPCGMCGGSGTVPDNQLSPGVRPGYPTAKKTAINSREAEGYTCPECGSDDVLFEDNDDSDVDVYSADWARCADCGWMGSSDDLVKTARKGNTMNREAQILRAMAKAGLAEQRALALELDQLRRERSAQVTAAREVDLADSHIRDCLTPVMTHTFHSAATDWIGEVPEEDGATESNGVMTNAMRTAATMWFNKVSSEVKADREEFAEQAMGMARREAGRYGERAAAARQAYLDHVAHLHRVAESGAELDADQSGEAVSKLPHEIPLAGHTETFDEDFWPEGDHEVSSERAPVIQENKQSVKTAARVQCQSCGEKFSTRNKYKMSCPNCGSDDLKSEAAKTAAGELPPELKEQKDKVEDPDKKSPPGFPDDGDDDSDKDSDSKSSDDSDSDSDDDSDDKKDSDSEDKPPWLKDDDKKESLLKAAMQYISISQTCPICGQHQPMDTREDRQRARSHYEDHMTMGRGHRGSKEAAHDPYASVRSFEYENVRPGVGASHIRCTEPGCGWRHKITPGQDPMAAWTEHARSKSASRRIATEGMAVDYDEGLTHDEVTELESLRSTQPGYAAFRRRAELDDWDTGQPTEEDPDVADWDEEDSTGDSYDYSPFPGVTSHRRQAADSDADQSGQAVSGLPQVEVGDENDKPMWPWELTDGEGEDEIGGKDAADVADVPTPPPYPKASAREGDPYAEADERAKQVIPSHFKASRTDRFKQTVQANLGRL